MTDYSRELASYAATLSLRDLPSEVVEHAKLCILDALGCALYGATLPWGKIVTEYAASLGGPPDSQIWGSALAVPASGAALVNGTLVHSFELDDLHKHSILHPTSSALPAALALADGSGVDVPGSDIIVAYVAGTEVGTRVGKSVATAQLTRGFHPTGTVGPVVAAAAAGRLLGLDPEQMLDALGIGATQGAGLMAAQFESMAKRFHAGRAAQSGVYAAQLAARGLKGIEAPFENEYGGFCVAYGGPDADFGILTDGLGETFETLQIGFKCYSSCGSTHTSIAAAQELKERHGLQPAEIASIDVEATTATYLHVGWPYRPGSVTRAQMNLTYATAVALTYGEAFVDQYTEAMIADPDLLRLANLVAVRPARRSTPWGPRAATPFVSR